MKVLFQIGKELGELRSRLESLERKACCASRESIASSAQSYSSDRSQPALPEPVPTDVLLASAGFFHRPPSVPVFVDGTILKSPRDIAKYNGRPLYYTPLKIRSGIALAAFTDRNAMISESYKLASALVAGTTSARSEHICQSPPDNLPEQACFFEHINEGGDILCLPPARAYSDLTRVNRGFLGLGDWNDLISSVTWSRWDVSLFEHIHYGGSQLWLPAGCNTPNLVELGWNDRASSIVNWGQRFSSQPVLG